MAKEKSLEPGTEFERGSIEETAYINKLNADIADLNDKYSTYVASKADLFDNTTSSMARMQKMRHMMMFGFCAMPLARGINRDAVIQAISMYVGMRLVDKDFQKDISKGVVDTLGPYVESKAEKAGPDSIWGKWSEKIKVAKNEGREPLDPDTAAVTQIGFIKQAYEDMRKPGADVNKISKEYENAVNTLYSVAEKDGVSKEAVNNSLKFMVGKLIETNPDNMKYFNETCYDGVFMDSYKEENVTTVDNDGKIIEKTQFVWDGSFKNKDGTEFKGTFSPRSPYTQDMYRDVLRDFCRNSMKKAVDEFPSEKQNDAISAIKSQIYESQEHDMENIDVKLGMHMIDNREAAAMKRKVKNLDDFDMGMGDMSDESHKAVTEAMNDSFRKLTASDKWVGLQDKILESIMSEDGMYYDDIQHVQMYSLLEGYADARRDYAYKLIDDSAESVRSEEKSRTAVHTDFKGRGHEFDDKFKAEDLQDDSPSYE